MSVSASAAWILDLDGTLYRAPPVKLALGLELLLSPRAIRPLQIFRASHEMLRREPGPFEPDPFHAQLRFAAERLEWPTERLAVIVERWMFVRPGPWLRRFARRDLLEEIAAYRAGGGRTALVSDYPARAKLEALGATGLFEVTVASGEVGGPPRLKPDPAGLLSAARRIEVPPARCLVIGDRPRVDGEAARRAGMAFREI